MRLTDPTVADELKKNYEALQAVGIDPPMIDVRYVKLSAYEDITNDPNVLSKTLDYVQKCLTQAIHTCDIHEVYRALDSIKSLRAADTE